MPSLTLKNIPAGLHRKLRARAVRNRRSLSSEIIACLEEAVESRPEDVQAELARIRALRRRIRGTLTDELLADLKPSGREGSE